MSVELDNAYQAQRARLAASVQAGAAAVWADSFRDRERTVDRVVPLVEAGLGMTVALVDAYMTAKATAAGEPAVVKGLDSSLYTIAALRGKDAREVYGRPFGALGGQLADGAEFGAALQSSQAALGRLVRTDLQLAQTRSARDWMAGEERVVGYRRVLGPGKNCALCRSASTRTYRREDLMPIHERCHCSVSPLFGSVAVASVGTKVRVVDDPELGPRLVADSWSESGPRLLEGALT